VAFWGTALVAGFIQGRGPGGLLGSVDAHNNAPGIFTVAVGIWAMVYTVIWVNAWTLTKWTMCASREGVSLMCRRRVDWDLPWGEMACWRPEFYAEGGALRAVVFWDKSGAERRIQCYDDPDAIDLTLADVVRQYAPPASERESVRVSHSEDMPSRPGV